MMFRVVIGISALALIFYLGQTSETRFPRVVSFERTGAVPSPGLSLPLWGQYSPFFSVPSDMDASIPEGCRPTLGIVLSRHGARYPTRKKLKIYQNLLDRIQRASDYFLPGYELINRTVLDPSSSRLTPLGQQEMVESGIAFYRRYWELASAFEVFVRASGSRRVIMSAHNFTQGFLGTHGKNDPRGSMEITVLPERDGFNNSLDHGLCQAFENGASSTLGKRKQKEWMAMWATPIMHKLNTNLGGANLTLAETVWLMDLCPFLSVISPNQTQSPICGLFSDEEWRGYDYHQSLGKWYGYGRGNSLGPTQGVGYVNELIARLTGRPVQDATTTNTTLDASPETFPLDRKLYVDFSHDNAMTAVHAAFGLYNQTIDLPVTHRLPPDRVHGYSASWTVPFAGRMYIEKMQCTWDKEDMVRVLVNDRVVPLPACGPDKLGRCPVDAFVASLSFARFNGLWSSCFPGK